MSETSKPVPATVEDVKKGLLLVPNPHITTNLCLRNKHVYKVRRWSYSKMNPAIFSVVELLDITGGNTFSSIGSCLFDLNVGNGEDTEILYSNGYPAFYVLGEAAAAEELVRRFIPERWKAIAEEIE